MERFKKTQQAAKVLNLPIRAVAVSKDFMEKYPTFAVKEAIELRILERFLPTGFW
ncbi:MAG: hypothetical protein ACOX05_04330 [Bacillota bacterium]|jgi:hypothetical protein